MTQIVGWGTVLYFPAAMGDEMARGLGTRLELIFGGVSLMYVVGALIAPWVGRRIDRHGAGPVMAVGSMIAAAGFLALAAARTPAQYLGAWLLLGGLCGGALSNAAHAAIAQACPRNPARGFAILVFATGLAGTVCLPAIHLVGEASGWRAVALAAAGLHLALCAPLHGWLLPRRASVGRSRPPRRRSVDVPRSATPTVADTPPRGAFPALALALSCNIFVTTGFALHLIGIFDALGVARSSAVLLISAIGPIQVGIRAAQIAVADRINPFASGLVGAAILPLGVCLLSAAAWTDHTVALPAAVGFIVLFAVANALMVVARAAIPYAVYGAARFGTWSGRLGAPQHLASAITPVAFAYALANWGGRGALLLAIIASVASLAALTVLVRLLRPVRGTP
ncbi:MFS transporter [Luteimonas sp. XNQY3]|nr:MFS transporter [Luteimonas sp. XNQY3]